MNATTNVLKFDRSKTVVAVAMTDAQSALFEMGEELGYSSFELESQWGDALRLCKTPADRVIMRAGFVSSYREARKTSEKAAQNRFDYLARKFSPNTSRKAASTKRKKGAGRPEKKGAAIEKGDAAKFNSMALHYIAKQQRANAGDDEMLEVLGAIAAILAGQVKA